MADYKMKVVGQQGAGTKMKTHTFDGVSGPHRGLCGNCDNAVAIRAELADLPGPTPCHSCGALNVFPSADEAADVAAAAAKRKSAERGLAALRDYLRASIELHNALDELADTKEIERARKRIMDTETEIAKLEDELLRLRDGV